MFKNSADEGHQKKTTKMYTCCSASPSVLKGHNRMVINISHHNKASVFSKRDSEIFYQSMQFRIKNEGF
jgi:hypothetical protein